MGRLLAPSSCTPPTASSRGYRILQHCDSVISWLWRYASGGLMLRCLLARQTDE